MGIDYLDDLFDLWNIQVHIRLLYRMTLSTAKKKGHGNVGSRDYTQILLGSKLGWTSSEFLSMQIPSLADEP